MDILKEYKWFSQLGVEAESLPPEKRKEAFALLHLLKRSILSHSSLLLLFLEELKKSFGENHHILNSLQRKFSCKETDADKEMTKKFFQDLGQWRVYTYARIKMEELPEEEKTKAILLLLETMLEYSHFQTKAFKNLASIEEIFTRNSLPLDPLQKLHRILGV